VESQVDKIDINLVCMLLREHFVWNDPKTRLGLYNTIKY
jgi:hypothetical protein